MIKIYDTKRSIRMLQRSFKRLERTLNKEINKIFRQAIKRELTRKR